MITVANRTETAARIKYAFDRGKIHIVELTDPEKTLHIDSKVLIESRIAAQEERTAPSLSLEPSPKWIGDVSSLKKLTKQQQAELLRLTVDTVGQPGKPGEQIQNVISVGMLSEGWDAKTVTYIMGLGGRFPANYFASRSVGRGLRRTPYELNPGRDGSIRGGVRQHLRCALYVPAARRR